MHSLSTWLQRRFALLVLAGTGLGFGLIVAELLLTDHTRGSQLIGVLAAVAGVVLALVAFVPSRRLRVLVSLAFVVLAGTGLLGVREHLEHAERSPEIGASFDRGAAPATLPADAGAAGAALVGSAAAGRPPLQRVQGSRFVAREGAEGRHRFGLAPLAPLALSGLSVLGALAALSLDADGRGPRRSVAGA